VTRRRCLGLSAKFSAAALLLGEAPKALALKGAAELDAEFYFRRLVDGNKPKDPKPCVPDPATRVDAAFVGRLETAFFDTLSKTSGKPQSSQRGRLSALLSQYEPAFQAKGPFPSEDLSNSRAVNFRVYCWWKLATETFGGDFGARKRFAEALGGAVLDDACVDNLALAARLATSSGARGPATAEHVLGALSSVLDFLQRVGFVQQFAVEADVADVQEDWVGGYPADVKLSLSRTVALGASLQLASEARPMAEPQSPTSGGFTTIDRFRPDLAGLAAGAVFRRFGVAYSMGEFFLDETYREDPNDVRPTLLLQQWSLEPPVQPLAPTK
jgi:hypothetical protein